MEEEAVEEVVMVASPPMMVEKKINPWLILAGVLGVVGVGVVAYKVGEKKKGGSASEKEARAKAEALRRQRLEAETSPRSPAGFPGTEPIREPERVNIDDRPIRAFDL